MLITDEHSAELELMEAAYGDDFKKLDPHHDFVRYCVKVHGGEDGEAMVVATFSLAPGFPTIPLSCTVDGLVPSIVLHELNKLLKAEISDDLNLGSMDVCQIIGDYINEWVRVEQSKKSLNTTDEKLLVVKIARFLIYFHHIMSSTKRKSIVENAQELKLGGISKTGFPGVVIVEGLLENVLEYVRRIQRLRWQQMVVRGEEVEIIDPAICTSETSVFRGCYGVTSAVPTGAVVHQNFDDIINRHRKILTCFYELPTTPEGGGMSVVGTFCKDCNIHALFMTAMKKYDTNA